VCCIPEFPGELYSHLEAGICDLRSSLQTLCFVRNSAEADLPEFPQRLDLSESPQRLDLSQSPQRLDLWSLRKRLELTESPQRLDLSETLQKLPTGFSAEIFLGYFY
jgi:hypothetical protein